MGRLEVLILVCHLVVDDKLRLLLLCVAVLADVALDLPQKPRPWTLLYIYHTYVCD